MPSLNKNDLETLEGILPNLNHYQLLKISPAATSDEIQAAFHREALLFHPDRYQKLKDTEMLNRARHIYLKIVEAYRTLSNRMKRQTYDESLKIKNDKKSSDSNNESEITTFITRKTNINSPAFKFLKLAQTSLQSGNIASAKMNIQLALNMEPENQEFTQFLQRLETHTKKKK